MGLIEEPRDGVPRAVVAIPACNEEERIGACLAALAGQSGLEAGTLGLLLFLNNCTDSTAAVVTAAALPCPLRVIERTHPQASAGWARRCAMEEAANWLRSGGRDDGVLLTTDADSRVDEDWVARNLAAIDAGASAVAGRLALDADEAARLPPALHLRGQREGAYEALLTEICARVDPEPGNPWPCHWSKSGATIAVTLEAYDLVGGMPAQPTGEDRAFIDAITARDLIVRHDPGIVVTTSGRLEGRATDGVADTIRLRCEVPESPCDDRLEPVLRVAMRCRLRRRLRRLWAAGGLCKTGKWAPSLAIPDALARQIATVSFFGEAYATVEVSSPRLRYEPIRPRQLPAQILIARTLLRMLRFRDRCSALGRFLVGTVRLRMPGIIETGLVAADARRPHRRRPGPRLS